MSFEHPNHCPCGHTSVWHFPDTACSRCDCAGYGSEPPSVVHTISPEQGAFAW